MKKTYMKRPKKRGENNNIFKGHIIQENAYKHLLKCKELQLDITTILWRHGFSKDLNKGSFNYEKVGMQICSTIVEKNLYFTESFKDRKQINDDILSRERLFRESVNYLKEQYMTLKPYNSYNILKIIIQYEKEGKIFKQIKYKELLLNKFPKHEENTIRKAIEKNCKKMEKYNLILKIGEHKRQTIIPTEMGRLCFEKIRYE